MFTSFLHSTSLVAFTVSFSIPTKYQPHQSHIRLYKMLSFRSILLAAAAFATLTSAIPTPIPDSGAALGPLSGLGTTVTGITGNVGGNMKRGDYSVADYFYNCHENLLEIVVKISKESLSLH